MITGLSRRDLLKRSGQGVAMAGMAAAGLALKGNPLGMPIGCQTFPVRDLVKHDFPATLKQLSAAGFQAIELCSPVGYAGAGFGSVGNYKPAELRALLADSNLSCVSSHFSIGELRKDLGGRIEWANAVGLRQMIIPTFGGPKEPTRDDVKRAAEEYNKIAEQSAKAGLQQGLHNEGFEMTSVDGKRTYDILFELLDPKLVKFQFQVSTISKGFDAAEYFLKYPGRFMSMHVQGWLAEEKKIAAVGKDSLDWKKIFAAAKTGGIQNYFVEMNLDLMQASVPYLKSLQV